MHKFTFMFRETGKTEDGAARENDARRKKLRRQSGGFATGELEKYRSPGDIGLRRDDADGLSRGGAARARGRFKNSDNTSPGRGAHLNVCIHTLVYRFDERCGQNYSN